MIPLGGVVVAPPHEKSLFFDRNAILNQITVALPILEYGARTRHAKIIKLSVATPT